VELDDGRVEVEIDYKVTGPSPAEALPGRAIGERPPPSRDCGVDGRSPGSVRAGSRAEAWVVATRGVGIGGPYAFLGELAKQVEARGFDAAWVSETTQESMIQASVVAQATQRIDVGTNITLAFPRSPTITAMQAWDLNELSGDRFVVGPRQPGQAHHRGPLLRRVRPAGQAHGRVRPGDADRLADGAGEDVTFDGDLYHVLRPRARRPRAGADRTLPRVYVAAVGPLMTKAAAAYADGLLGHPFTSERYLTDDVLPRVEEALAAAGRSREDFTVCQGVILTIADDREVAVREAKQQIAFYGTTPNYQGVFASYGDEALTGRLRDVWATTRQDLDALVAAVPDEAVERYAIAGTPDEVKDRLAAYERHVDHLILGGAWYKVPMSRMGENLWAILETFGTPDSDRRRAGSRTPRWHPVIGRRASAGRSATSPRRPAPGPRSGAPTTTREDVAPGGRPEPGTQRRRRAGAGPPRRRSLLVVGDEQVLAGGGLDALVRDRGDHHRQPDGHALQHLVLQARTDAQRVDRHLGAVEVGHEVGDPAGDRDARVGAHRLDLGHGVGADHVPAGRRHPATTRGQIASWNQRAASTFGG
jgi:probable F420-dependent oxidoreductase